MRVFTGGFAAALLLAATMASASRFQEKPAVFEGSVVDALTGLPVAGARVTIAEGISGPPELDTLTGRPVRAGGAPTTGTNVGEVRMLTPPDASPRRTILSVVTDHLGKFGFAELAPGTYTLASSADGYVYQLYGQKIAFGLPTPLMLAAGSNNGFVVRLNPAASVTGAITNEERLAVAGITVYLLRPEFSVNGDRLYRVEKDAMTDDAGRYLLSGIPAGRFYIVTGAPKPGPASPQMLLPYDWTYYPGVPEAGLAAQFDLQAGARMDLGTLVLRKQEQRRVSGRIVDSRTGKPPQSVNLSLKRPFPFERAGIRIDDSRRGKYDPSTGTFEFTNVPRGTYRIDASLPQEASPQTNTSFIDSILGMLSRDAPDDAFTIVDVSAGDANDVLLTVPGTSTLRGKVILNGGTAVASIKLASAEFFLEATQPLQPVVGRTPVKSDDGTFEVRASLAGRYRFVVSPLPDNFFVSDARLAGERFPNGILDIPGNAVSDLVITLSSDGGQIDGTVVDEKSQPVPRVQGVLLPDPLPEAIGIYHFIWSDGEGRFAERGVAPGNYRIYVWDSVGEQQYFDRELLMRSRTQATPIRIDPGSRISPTVKIIVP